MSQMHRILLVEDEANIREPLADFLRSEGYDVLTAEDGETGLELALGESPDLVVLDIMLPRLDGFTVCRKIRKENTGLPIIMLTARASEEDRVDGLDLGADDYVVKPFGVKELAARIRARLRVKPSESIQSQETTVRFGDNTVDRKARRVTRSGSEVELRAMEWALLEFFFEHEGELLERNDILNAVWGYEQFPTTRTVDTHVYKLRQKLEDDPQEPRHFVTVHGMGYRFLRNPES